MRIRLSVLAGVAVSGVALNACSNDGSLSGKYVADQDGARMVIDFIDSNRATFSVGAGEEGSAVDCTYQVGETLITLNCMGSSGISLTRVDGGLEANMGGMLVRYKKQ